MSSKQIAQTTTNLRCEIPKIIGNKWQHLSDTTRLFKFTCPLDGEVVYSNEQLMIVNFYSSDSPDDGSFLKVFEVPEILQCSGLYATRLRYKREIGPFQRGELLYEYDCFRQSIPTYGYTFNTAYMPWFGFDHEDAIVISESVADKCRSTKLETIIIPIYMYSLFKNIYNKQGDYGFIPGIGHQVNGNIVAYKTSLRSEKNVVQSLKMLNTANFEDIIDNELQFKTSPITTRIENGFVTDIKIHRVQKDQKLIDKKLYYTLEKMMSEYKSRLTTEFKNIEKLIDINFSKHILEQYYIFTESASRKNYSMEHLIYLLEVTIRGESKTKIGDKFANRFFK
jgi:DNA-directed RNA polymerase beta subunit